MIWDLFWGAVIFWAIGHLLGRAGFMLPYFCSGVLTVVIFLTRHGMRRP